MRVYEGTFDARDLRVALVASRFNETVVKRLVEGAVDCLKRHGVDEDAMSVTWVPGAFELPAAVARLVATGEVDAVVALGVVIRGDTPHFDYVAGGAATGIAEISRTSGIPVGFGVLTTDTTEQAEARAGGKLGNKGFEAAATAIEMAGLFDVLPKPQRDL